MEKMFRAAVLIKQKYPLEILDLYEPQLTSGQVKIRMITAGLCGAQINEIYGVKGPDKYLPHLMGHEGFGQVLEISEDVTTVQIGDYVICHWRKGSGLDVFGGVYNHPDLGKIGSGPVTTFSEISIVSENRVSKIIPSKEAVDLYPLLGCALTTAYGIVNLESSPRPSNKILIIGGGGLGISIGLMLKCKGISNLFFVEKNEIKLSDIFDSIFTSSKVSKFNNLKFDFIYETTGDVNLISNCFDLLEKNGCLVMVGQPNISSELIIKNPLSFFEGKRIFASDGGGFNPAVDMNKVNSIMTDNISLFKKLISHKIPLDQINHGFNMMLKGDAKRITIKFGDL